MKKIIYIFSIFAMGQILTAQTESIGVNKNEKLRSEVDVNGEVSIENVPISTKTLPRLYINTNEDSRKLGILPENSRPFTILRFKINTKDKDWVNDFDTAIPSDKYQLILSDAYFTNEDYEKNLKTYFPNPIIYGISHTYQNGHSKDADKVYNVEQNIKLRIKDGHYDPTTKKTYKTWHIFADFYGADPYCRNNNDPHGSNRAFDCNKYFWKMTFLVVRKDYVANLNNYVSESTSNNVNILSTLLNQGEANVEETSVQ